MDEVNFSDNSEENLLYDRKKIDQEIANQSFGIVFQLLLSSLWNIEKIEEPRVGDWCVELTSIYTRDCNLLGVVKEINGDSYIIQTILGQFVHWTNCKMVKIPSNLLQTDLHSRLLNYIKENEECK